MTFHLAILLSTNDILLSGTMTATIVMMSAALDQKKIVESLENSDRDNAKKMTLPSQLKVSFFFDSSPAKVISFHFVARRIDLTKQSVV